MESQHSSQTENTTIYDYFYIVIKHKFLILACAIVAVVVAAAAFKLMFQRYSINYTYNKWDTTYFNYELFLDRFYSEENIDWLINQLRKAGCDDYASRLEDSRESGRTEIFKYINFRIWPENLQNMKLEFLSMDNIRELADFPVRMMRVGIINGKNQELKTVGEIVRNNVENRLPLYNLNDSIVTAMIGFRHEMSQIQRSRQVSLMEIEKEQAILEKLSKIPNDIDAQPNNTGIMLQMDLSEQSDFMPLEYQKRAAQARIINKQEQMNLNKSEEEYYRHLLELYSKILSIVSNGNQTDISLNELVEKITELQLKSTNNITQDHLNAFLRDIEIVIARSTPATQTPKLQRTGGFNKVLILSLAIGILGGIMASFVLEGIKLRKMSI